MLIKKSIRKIMTGIMALIILISSSTVYSKQGENLEVTPYYYIDSSNQLAEYFENDFKNFVLTHKLLSHNDYTYKWVEFNRTYFSPSQVKKLAEAIKRNQSNLQIASIILTFIPTVGPGISALAQIVALGGNRVIVAADKNQSMIIVQEKKVGYWDGYSPRTRHRYIFQ